MARMQDIMDNLVLQYEGYFNLEQPHAFLGEEIPLYARFTQRVARYLVVKRAQLYATEANEHVFIVHHQHLNMEAWEKEKARICAAESSYVSPHKEHMYSYVTLLVLAETIDESVKKAIRRLRFTRNYRFSLQGYSTVRVAALELKSEEIVHNTPAKEVGRVLSQALHM